jgi:hypothetical protein
MSTEETQQTLRAEIAKRRAELSALDRQREMAHDELGRLESELAALDDLRPDDRPDGAGPGRAAPETPAEKVALFRARNRASDAGNARTKRSPPSPTARSRTTSRDAT